MPNFHPMRCGPQASIRRAAQMVASWSRAVWRGLRRGRLERSWSASATTFTEPPHPLRDGRAGDAEQAGHFGLGPAVHHLFDQLSASHGSQATVTMGHEGPPVTAGFRSHNSNSEASHLSTTSMGTTPRARQPRLSTVTPPTIITTEVNFNPIVDLSSGSFSTFQ